MIFPDAVTVLRSTAADEYGNPAASWAAPSELPARAFVPGSRERALFPLGTDLRVGDRLRLADGTVHDVLEPTTVRSPSRPVLVKCGLRRVEA